MIHLINNNEIIDKLVNQGYRVIKSPEKRFNQVLAYCKGIDNEIAKIIHSIDECKIEGNNVISKFTNTPIEISRLSEGSKIAVYVYFRAKLITNNQEIIDITGCGPNAIGYILKNYSNGTDLMLKLMHFEFPDNIESRFMLNHEEFNNTDELFYR